MESVFLTISVLLFLVSLVLAIVTLIRDIRRKERGKLRRLYLIGFAVSIVLIIIGGSSGDVSTMLTGLAVLCIPAALVLFVICIVRKAHGRERRKPLIAAVVLTAVAVAMIVGSSCIMNARLFGKNAMDAYEIHIKADYDFEVKDGDEPLDVITSTGLNEDTLISSSRYVYDSCDLPLILDNCPATAEQCLKAIRENDFLGAKYKNYFSDFVQRIAKKYPDADLSMLYHNLKTLRVIELDKMDYITKSLSIDSYGCYVMSENTIYIPKGTEYVEGEWGFQVLVHEFCHAARIVHEDVEDGKNRVQFCTDYNNILLEESMNSAFSCSLLNYDERDIAYQVPSNYLRIMLECMDNYGLSDYFNHSELYFLSKLDEYTGYTNYAQVIWKLITLQRSDWEDDKIDIPAEEYHAIYEYLCEMYYGKYITADMNEQERNAVAAELVDKAFFDAPENYKIDEQFFYDYLKNIA